MTQRIAALTDLDLAQLAAHGISPETAERQLHLLREPPSPVVLDRPATVDDGIVRLDASTHPSLLELGDDAAATGRVSKFVPASGAATRMFKDLITAYEAEGISGFVSNSPLMYWAYQLFSKGQFSAILGIAEILTAVLIAARPFSARLSALGSASAVGMFLTTLTFLFSTPGVIETSLGFPALSAVPGQFLIKDVVLLGAALWTTGEALRAVRRERM